MDLVNNAVMHHELSPFVCFRAISAVTFATHFHRMSANEYMGFSEEYEVQRNKVAVCFPSLTALKVLFSSPCSSTCPAESQPSRQRSDAKGCSFT